MKLSKPSLSGKQVGMPSFLTDLISDMRDRHLLPVAGVLLVAIAGVLVLLSGMGANPKPVAADTGAVIPKSGQARVAVVAQSDPGVREYKQRLSGRASNDPFNQKGVSATDSSGSQLETVSPAGVDATSAGSSNPSSSGSGSTPTGGGGSSQLPPGSTANESGSTNATFASYAVDTKVGEPGNLKDRKDIAQLDMLPSEGKPVFVFMGVSKDGKKALFLVSNVLSLSGSGSCLVTVAICQLVALKQGDQADIRYALDLKTYRLKVTDIRKLTG
jgi:hypothetical protein